MNDIFERCCTAIITDVCDRMSIEYNLILDLKTRFNQKKIYGNARTMLLKEQNNCNPNLDIGLDLIQTLKNNDILFVNGSQKFAYFGELLGLYCDLQNIKGVIVNGRTRDSFSFKNYSYPVYSKGYTPIDIVGRGKIEDVDCQIDFQNGSLKSGDFVFCDWEGCVSLTTEDINKILPEIKKEINKERQIKSMILNGDDLKSISKKIKYI